MVKKQGYISIVLVTYGKFIVAIPRLLSLYGPDYTNQLATDFSKQGFVVTKKTLSEFGGENALHKLYWDRREMPNFGDTDTYFLSSRIEENKAITDLKLGDRKTVSRKEQLLIFSNDRKPALTLDADFIVPARE